MDETLITNWNEVVGPEDKVYHLGDIVFSKEDTDSALSLLERLNGKIFLIKGNHDRSVINGKCRRRSEWVKDIHVVRTQVNGAKQDIILMHYLMRTWD